MNEKDAVQLWNQRYREAVSARMSYERQWLLNIAYIFGKQWVTWSNASGSPNTFNALVEPIPQKGRVRLTVNYCRMYSQKMLAKLNKERPRGFVVPSTSDNSDIAAARAAEKVVDYLIDETLLPVQFKRADYWAVTSGTSFIKTWYNPGKASRSSSTTPDGFPEIEAISPFHVLVPELMEPEIERQSWVMHCSVRTRDAIQSQYPDADLSNLKDEGLLGSNLIDSKLMAATGRSQGSNRRKGVEVKEIWVKPGKEHPNGAVLTIAGETLIQYIDSWPVPFKEFPFYKRQFLETGMFYGETPITDVIAIQTEYNRSRSQILEAKNKMSAPQLVAQRGSIVDIRKWTNKPGQIIEYNPGTNPPQALQLPGMPGYVLDSLSMSKREMDDLTSQHEISDGRVPPGVEAATAIAYLGENQDSALADTIRDKEIAHAWACRQLLAYTGLYWDAERFVRVVGMNNNFEAFLFKGSDLRDSTDYRVVVGSATPTSYAAKQAQFMELMKIGAIPPEKALEFLQLGDITKLTEEMQIDYRHAERENLKISQGAYADVENWHEHLVHIKTHDNYRKREEFESLPPERQQALRMHVFMHMYTLAMGQGVQIPMTPGIMQGEIDPNAERLLRQFVTDLTKEVSNGNAAG